MFHTNLRDFHSLFYDIKYISKCPTQESVKLLGVLKNAIANKKLNEPTEAV